MADPEKKRNVVADSYLIFQFNIKIRQLNPDFYLDMRIFFYYISYEHMLITKTVDRMI